MPFLWRCKDGDGYLFLDCTFPLILHVTELPEFMPFMARDRSRWPRCLLWQAWLPGLRIAGERDSLLTGRWSVFCVLIWLMILPSGCGLMVAGTTIPRL